MSATPPRTAAPAAPPAPRPDRPSQGLRGGLSPLRQERKRRGWSQAKLIAELREAAAQEGYRLAGHYSLVSMISRWENGRCQPDALYRHLLCTVYGKTSVELGLVDPGDGIDVTDGRVWLTLEDFADALGVPMSTAYRWSHLGTQSGKFPRCVKLPNGKVRIRRDWLEEWLDGLSTA